MNRTVLLMLPLACLLAGGCKSTMYQASFHQLPYRARLDRDAPFLKAHTLDGEVFVLADWKLDERRQRVEGSGLRYDVKREVRARGALVVPYDRIVLLETNRPERVSTHNQLAAMILMTTASLGITAYCLAYGVCF
jgi:hypothetical protein